MDNLQELMTITMEECGELIQECSKAIRCENYHNNDKLTEEVGDVMCMIDLLHEYDLISWDDVDARVLEKKKKLKKWSDLLDG
jgi:NTP pyrophosphatase (non-canonical NTP hydrolase)